VGYKDAVIFGIVLRGSQFNIDYVLLIIG